MRFGILGPFAVWTADGNPVTIPGLKVRALLADLLLHDGHPVSPDRLVDDLWGDQPPSNPAGALQVKVSQLRKALEEAEPGGRDLVVSHPAGYRMRIDPTALDAGQFEALAGKARKTEDLPVRAALLGDALALWRGSALADFADDPFTRAAITRLEEQRLTALEDQAETRLRLGEHNLLAGELGDLVERHPLRERLRAIQLRALYQAGRQSEALAAFRELRERLRDELGLDPGPELAELHQAILDQDPGLRPAPAPAATHRTNLPAARTGLIGRQGAIAEIRTLLEAERLVTLTGPGGVGKTRLAIEVARTLTGSYADGVFLVEFAAVDRSSPARPAPIVETITAALGIQEAAHPVPGPPVDPFDRLADAVRTRRALLVFDNCEHVIDPVATVVDRLLAGAPELTVLLTSQESARIPGERVWAVPPLEGASAVELFAARAAAAAPGFVLDDTTTAAVATICQRLDGIPLALELAASRVRAIGVTELADRLDDRFRLLAGSGRGAPARQRTLRAVIDWSWDLLDDQERAVLRRLAVHSDGCTLEAAEAVCAAADVPASAVFDVVSRLVDRSLVVATGGPRYRLLESVAAYGLERLREAGEEDRVRELHCRYHVDLVERARPLLEGHQQREWLVRLDAEAANLRVALDDAERRGDAGLALRLVNAAAWYWVLRGRLAPARRALATALATESDHRSPARLRAEGWLRGLALISHLEDGAARPVDEILRAYEQVDDPAGRARTGWFFGFATLGGAGLAAGEEVVGRALAEFRRLGDRWGVAAALSSRAMHALVRGDLAALRREAEQSLALFQELGDQWGQLHAIEPLAALAEVLGDYDRAGRLHRDGLRIADGLGLPLDVSYRLSGLGRLALLAGDYPAADDFHERARRQATEQGARPAALFAEVGLGLSARRQGRLDDSERHFRLALDWNRRMAYEPGIAQSLAELGFSAEQRGDAGSALAHHLEGWAMTRKTGDARAVALALEGLAGQRALAGDPVHAARLLGTAAAARESVGAPLPEAESVDVDRIAAAARDALGAADFDAEFAAGGKMAPDDHLTHPAFQPSK